MKTLHLLHSLVQRVNSLWPQSFSDQLIFLLKTHDPNNEFSFDKIHFYLVLYIAYALSTLSNHFLMFFMLLFTLIINKNIIYKYKNKLIQVLAETNIYETCECSLCISDTKWHNHKFIVAIHCFKSCLMNILFINSKSMITRLQINIQKYFFSSLLVKQFISPMKCILFLHYKFIQFPISNA
jgi:hypothetical protein